MKKDLQFVAFFGQRPRSGRTRTYRENISVGGVTDVLYNVALFLRQHNFAKVYPVTGKKTKPASVKYQ